MSLETNSFEFGEFLLDAKEKVLLRHGQPLSITPKTFQLLQILVENHGHLVERIELLNTVWADSFVEEGNLTFTIRLLRKALGDSKQSPRFIETVAKRGYRFIAEVNEIASNGDTPKTFSEPLEKNSGNSLKFIFFLLPAAAALIFAIVSAGFWFSKSKSLKADAPILSAPFAMEKLSTNGKTLHAVISADGKNMVYTQGTGNDKESVWLRQLDAGNNVEIVPPSDDFYNGLALSPDGNFLYFARQPRGQEGRFDVFRVSIFGGIPAKILSQTEGWIRISPDGERISFVRCPNRDEESCSLFIADALDGKNERKIVSRTPPTRIGDSEISPDGKRIVFAVGQSNTGANEFGLMEVEIETGAEREVMPEKFFNIHSLVWFPDQNSLLVTASKVPARYYRIWLISTAGGEAVPLTQDSENYVRLSLDKSASRLISTQTRQDFRLHLFETENPLKSRILADATFVAFAPGGKILFTSMMSGNHEIWSIKPDGSGQRQLTNDPAVDYAAVASPAKDSIFFASNRTGETQVWKMDADGSNQTQITHKEGGAPLLVSSDGRWLYYHHALQKTLWRVPVEGGEEQLSLNKTKHQIAVSPDGSQAVFEEKQGEEKVLTILRLADGQMVKTFKFAEPRAALRNLKWSPDGNSLMYILAASEYENNILWQQPLSGNPPQKIADLGNELITGSGFALAPDGKNFAVTKGGWQHDAILLKGLK